MMTKVISMSKLVSVGVSIVEKITKTGSLGQSIVSLAYTANPPLIQRDLTLIALLSIEGANAYF